MRVDRFFKSLERRTERDLYRKAFKATLKSQKDLYESVSGGVKKEKIDLVKKAKGGLLSTRFVLEILLAENRRG